MSVYQKNEVKEEETIRTLSLIVDNQPGTLARVIGLFSGRGYNIDCLNVTEIDNKRNLSRISLVTRGTSMTIEQIKALSSKDKNVKYLFHRLLTFFLFLKKLVSR